MSIPILVLHGALGAAAQMRPIADALGALGPVRTLEFPGHGATPALRASAADPGTIAGDPSAGPIPFDLSAFATWLGGEIGDTRPIVFGYSMGGYVALLLESRAPDSVRAIATLGTKFEWTPESAAREVARLDARVIAEKVPKFAAMLEARQTGEGGWERVVASTAAMLTAAGAAPALTAERLGAVRCPVELAVGALDDTVGADETARAAQAVRDGRTTVLENVWHPIERVPPVLVRALVERLRARVAT